MSEKRHQSRLLHIPITEVQMTLDIGSTYVVLLYMNSASSSSVIVDFHLMSIMIICDMPARLGCLCHYGPICTVSALRY